MNHPLKFLCEWWGPSGQESKVMQACRVGIEISVDSISLTRLEDNWANTIRNQMNGNAYPLAYWLAANWWRLRWEPETQKSQSEIDWCMSHYMGSAGDGFCWPNIWAEIPEQGSWLSLLSLNISRYRQISPDTSRYLQATFTLLKPKTKPTMKPTL